MKKRLAVFMLFLLPTMVFPQQGTMKTGYAVVTLVSPGSGRFLVSETLGLKTASDSIQTEMQAANLTTSAVWFVNASDSLGRNSGVTLVNPWTSAARVTLTVRREDGVILATKTIIVPAHWQTSQLITQIFSDQPDFSVGLTGMLAVKSSLPMGMMALRFRGNTFSAGPITRLDQAASLPVLLPGIGGSSAALFPQVAAGSGWASEFVIANLDTVSLTFRVDVFAQDGSPMAIGLNGKTASTFFGLLVLPGGVLTISPLDTGGNSQF